MEFTETAPRQLSIKGGLPVWLGVLVLIPAILGVVFLLLWQPYTLTCVRSGDCTLDSGGFLGSSTERFPAESLGHADLEKDFQGRTYRVVVEVDDKTVPLSAVYSSGRAEKQAEAKKINDFIANGGPSELAVGQDDGALLLIGLVLLALGLALTYFIPRRYTTILDGEAHEVRHRKSWLGLGRERRVPFSELSGLDVTPSITVNGQPWVKAALRTEGRPLVVGYGAAHPDMLEQLERIRAIVKPRKNRANED